ncbi:small membrane protein [Klebsiella variicola]|nr:small membrane protein [Klebsiella variicola]
MEIFLWLMLCVVLLVVAIYSFISYISERRRLKVVLNQKEK